jgi:hypothetical protein
MLDRRESGKTVLAGKKCTRAGTLGTYIALGRGNMSQLQLAFAGWGALSQRERSFVTEKEAALAEVTSERDSLSAQQRAQEASSQAQAGD